MTSPVIRIENLSKYYGKHRGIEDVSFEVNKGEIFGYLGPNGAGKTTTIRIMLGFLHSYRGNVNIFNGDIKKDLLTILSRSGYLPGELSLYGNLKVAEFLEYFSKLNKRNEQNMMQDLLERFGCEPDKKISSLSTGNKQKVGIIQAIMNDPDLVILDEPTRGLDPLMRQEFYSLLRELKNRGRTILLSSHVLTEVEKVCDSAAIIREGKIVAIEDIHSLKTKNYKILEITCRGPLNRQKIKPLKNITGLEFTENKMKCHLHGDIDPLLKALGKNYIIDIESYSPGLEDVFIKFYGDQNAG